MYTQIVEFEDRLVTHQQYTFKRYNQLKTVVIYLKTFFDNGGSLSDRQAQLDMLMELENEIECLQNLRYSDEKDIDFILRVNTTLRIVHIMKNYVQEPVNVVSPMIVSFWGNLKHSFLQHKQYSPFDLIHQATATWAQGN